MPTGWEKSGVNCAVSHGSTCWPICSAELWDPLLAKALLFAGLGKGQTLSWRHLTCFEIMSNCRLRPGKDPTPSLAGWPPWSRAALTNPWLQ